MMHECENCRALEQELARALYERDQARAAAATATDLTMKGEALRERAMLGEALRERAMLGAILAGDTDQKKENLVYILTGRRR